MDDTNIELLQLNKFSSRSNCELCLQIRDFVSEQMSVRGIEFHTEESPQAITKSADGSFSLKTNKGTVDGFSHIMFATGRRPNTQVLFSIILFYFYVVICLKYYKSVLTMKIFSLENDLEVRHSIGLTDIDFQLKTHVNNLH